MNFKEMNYKQKYLINTDIKFLILVTWVHENTYTQLYGMIQWDEKGYQKRKDALPF